ncbi:Aste57867_8201 [Aphanomyces stellatus]|uniref:Aste57867_8201 protein n=1 Tax=Aphanomyces stellatus TaxID=120398 RepID=A0A485KJL2_9STRA|nr:hypothetical protein As57867_008170 [Aphanomyces stellatus]VFT85088.1 Aste57867_8201 [Aphanomyces stellatus]
MLLPPHPSMMRDRAIIFVVIPVATITIFVGMMICQPIAFYAAGMSVGCALIQLQQKTKSAAAVVGAVSPPPNGKTRIRPSELASLAWYKGMDPRAFEVAKPDSPQARPTADEPAPVIRSNLSCPVCLDAIELPVATKCGHIYCTHCLDQWWAPGRKSARCPTCNKRLLLKDLVKLYPYFD